MKLLTVPSSKAKWHPHFKTRSCAVVWGQKFGNVAFLKDIFKEYDVSLLRLFIFHFDLNVTPEGRLVHAQEKVLYWLSQVWAASHQSIRPVPKTPKEQEQFKHPFYIYFLIYVQYPFTLHHPLPFSVGCPCSSASSSACTRQTKHSFSSASNAVLQFSPTCSPLLPNIQANQSHNKTNHNHCQPSFFELNPLFYDLSHINGSWLNRHLL